MRLKADMSCFWAFCWLSWTFLSFSTIHTVSCTLQALSTTSMSDRIVLYEGVLTYDNADRPNDRVVVFPFADGCDQSFCEKFNADVLTTNGTTSILYNSCVCQCKDGVVFDVKSTKCLSNISNSAITAINNMSSAMDNLIFNVSTSASYELDSNDSYDDFNTVTAPQEDGLEFLIWMICMSASFILCVLFVYSAFEKRKQKRKQGKDKHSTLQSKYYAHEVAGVRKTLMECYNMPLIKARLNDEAKCETVPDRYRFNSDDDYIDSLSGSRESFLHPKWESRAPRVKNPNQEISDHESFGKWTPAYTQQLQSKRKVSTSRKTPSSDANAKTSALGKRFNSVGRRICTSSAFLNLYRQKRAATDASSGDSTIAAIASPGNTPATTPSPTEPNNSIDTVINFNGQSEEAGVIGNDVILNV
ncbi:uncharacterized protein LOC117119337 [Anneissia japonica]|uniref:uncharacterized protein LOC117119337 n=1 Tax=Anneissia japonica TaxID=1529436 RepID=UPI0014255DD2|nr:uncharacterized protein LOC117119337 [Anneissia japonica]